jgi:hypothetical protein
VLVPALVVLVGERSWFPSRLTRAAVKPARAEQSAA